MSEHLNGNGSGGMGAEIGRSVYGGRGTNRALLKTLAKSAPDLFIELATPLVPKLVRILDEDLEDRHCIGHRTAVGALMDGLKITNRTGDVLAALLERWGVGSEEEALRRLTMAAGAENATQESTDQQWLTYGRRRMKDPRFRQWAREVLFGEREVEVQGQQGS